MFYSELGFDWMRALRSCSCLTSLSLMFPLTLPFKPQLCLWSELLKFSHCLCICLFFSFHFSIPRSISSLPLCLHFLIPLSLCVIARRFMNLKMRSMVFEDSLFEECYFEDITSSNTFFKNCTFIATLFYNTGRLHTHWHCIMVIVRWSLKSVNTIR